MGVIKTKIALETDCCSYRMASQGQECIAESRDMLSIVPAVSSRSLTLNPRTRENSHCGQQEPHCAESSGPKCLVVLGFRVAVSNETSEGCTPSLDTTSINA